MRAWEEAGLQAYAKDPRSKWWCGYQGQVNVVLDEFRGGVDISHLLRWFDRYPCTVETKGASRPLVAEKIWVTSNLDPRQWYPDLDEETVSALLRRLNITHFNYFFSLMAYGWLSGKRSKKGSWRRSFQRVGRNLRTAAFRYPLGMAGRLGGYYVGGPVGSAIGGYVADRYGYQPKKHWKRAKLTSNKIRMIGSNPPKHRFGSNPGNNYGSNPGHIIGSNPSGPIVVPSKGKKTMVRPIVHVPNRRYKFARKRVF